MLKLIKRNVIILFLLMVGFGTACDDIFNVESPGLVTDSDLNSSNESAAPLVTGMSADLSVALANNIYFECRFSDEMAASGSFWLSGRARVGMLTPEDIELDVSNSGMWETTQQARFAAEDGLDRMQNRMEGYEFEGNPLTARAYLMAGFANRLLGEQFCRVAYDGSEAFPREVALERAVDHFTNAIEHADMAGATNIMIAAYGGRAQAYVGLGEWENAVSDANQVINDFIYEASYSANSGRENNIIYNQTHIRSEMSVFKTIAMGPFEENGEVSFVPPEERDPRTPYTDCRFSDDCVEFGNDGVTENLRQEKYNDFGSNIPLVQGAEMRLIEAEAHLLNDEMESAMDKINEVRSEIYGLDEITVDEIGETGQNGFTEGTAWWALDEERYKTLWLEGRRLNDLDRWDHPFLYGLRTIVHEQQVTRRASCIPISIQECDTNDNITCVDIVHEP